MIIGNQLVISALQQTLCELVVNSGWTVQGIQYRSNTDSTGFVSYDLQNELPKPKMAGRFNVACVKLIHKDKVDSFIKIYMDLEPFSTEVEDIFSTHVFIGHSQIPEKIRRVKNKELDSYVNELLSGFYQPTAYLAA